MAADLAIQLLAAVADTQYVALLAVATQHKQLTAQLGQPGALALILLNQEQELVLLETHA